MRKNTSLVLMTAQTTMDASTYILGQDVRQPKLEDTGPHYDQEEYLRIDHGELQCAAAQKKITTDGRNADYSSPFSKCIKECCSRHCAKPSARSNQRPRHVFLHETPPAQSYPSTSADGDAAQAPFPSTSDSDYSSDSESSSCGSVSPVSYLPSSLETSGKPQRHQDPPFAEENPEVFIKPVKRELTIRRQPGPDHPCCKEVDESQWNGPFTFVQAADTQLGFSDDAQWGGKGTGNWDEDITTCRQLVENVNAMEPAPRFVVVCGDLGHAMPPGLTPEGGRAGQDSDTKAWKSQNEAFKAELSALKVPLVCVCGNHDVGNRPTPQSLAAYESLYGSDYFGLWCGGMRALVLNAQLFSDPRDAMAQQAEQEAWLLKELALIKQNKTKHAVIFQHIPWFIESEDEETGYFNIEKEKRQQWLQKFQDAGVSKIFCGHYHRNAGGLSNDGEVEVVITSAVGRQLTRNEVADVRCFPGEKSDIRHGMRIVTVGEDRITHKYHEFGQDLVSLEEGHSN